MAIGGSLDSFDYIGVMVPQHADSHSSRLSEVATITRSTSSSDLNPIEEAGRAVDHAIRSIFELATSLEFLSDAIRRFNAESKGQ